MNIIELCRPGQGYVMMVPFQLIVMNPQGMYAFACPPPPPTKAYVLNGYPLRSLIVNYEAKV